MAINFLGYTAKEFFNLSAELKPFGDGPWPCLNPVCKHFKKPIIKEYHITSYYCSRHAAPVGTFQCICGFTYSREGPDSSAEDQFKKSANPTIYGSLWELNLIKLWDDEAISLRQITRRLGVNSLTVRRQAALLELKFPRVSAGRSIKLTSALLDYCLNSKPEIRKLKTLEYHKSKFIEFRQQHPLARVSGSHTYRLL